MRFGRAKFSHDASISEPGACRKGRTVDTLVDLQRAAGGLIATPTREAKSRAFLEPNVASEQVYKKGVA